MTPPPAHALASHATLPWSVCPPWLLWLYRKPWVALELFLIGPLVAMGVWVYAAQERQWRAREGEDLLVAARLAARIIDEELMRTRHMQEAVAARPGFLEALMRRNENTLTTYLHILLEAVPMLDRASVTDAAGQALAEVSSMRSGTDGDAGASQEPSLTPLALQQQPVSGVYLRDEASGEKMVRVSSAVHAGPQLVGAVQVQYRLRELSRWLEKVRVEPAGFLYVVDREGHLVTYPFQLLPGKPKDVSGWSPVAHHASAQGRLLRFRHGAPARPWTAAVIALEPYGWRVIAQQPDAAMLQPLHRLLGSCTALLILLGSLMGFLARRWAHLHETALRLLAQQARLLRISEQRRLRVRLRQAPPPQPPADAT
ncbi:MAG: cache domain-containing protein [Candidatus Omnitrophota bacterium]|nr:cache domain-containing protein [Candidatus Omnitrophota bacterium]